MNSQPIPLGRSVLGMFAGYVLSVVLLLLMVTLCYLELGSDGGFEPGSYRDSSLFEILKLACGFVAAICAGWFACRIGGKRAAVMLAFLMVVSGVVSGAIAWNKQASRIDPWVERPQGAVNFTVASENTQNSPGYILAMPFVGLAGSLIGGAICAAIRRGR
ncbi:MAG: hypothetical protein NT059_02765 [Planctomycetota bacterium]|nr:hypothetical protein [Planctomycetota bacterium]